MRIWTGRAGSGKTTAILREIAALSERGEGRQILLVPELNSHLMERRLAAATHNHGARTAEVLTFSRLADRVFSEVGGLAQQMLTPAGQLLTLPGLFKDDADYVSVISEYITSEMKRLNAEENGMFFIDGEENDFDGFKEIKPDQNFYINENGNIVICFDKYEVAAGAQGSPEFEIPNDLIADLRK